MATAAPAPATLNDYRTIVETKLKPALGKLRLPQLPQLDPVTLDRFYGQLRRRGRNDAAPLSASRVRQVHAVLSGALGLAARYGWIGFNPARLTRPPAAENDKRQAPTSAAVREALAAAEQDDPVSVSGSVVHVSGLERGYGRRDRRASTGCG